MNPTLPAQIEALRKLPVSACSPNIANFLGRRAGLRIGSFCFAV